jgi:hypothetical protein
MALLATPTAQATSVRGVPVPIPRLGPPRTRSGRPADPLTLLCFDAWLLASHAPPGVGGLPDGRRWEQSVAAVLVTAGFGRRQGPGTTTLLGATSASGVAHELDGVGRVLGPEGTAWDETVILESKAVTSLNKTEVTSFWAKVFDFYAGAVPTAGKASWHAVLISAATVSTALRKLCAQRGVVLVDPERIPLPVLLWMAGRPNADDRLPGTLLAECLRLGTPAVASVQQRWPVLSDGRIAFDPCWWDAASLADLCFVHDELSGAVLDVYDRDMPGALERRAGALAAELHQVS